MKDIRMAKGKSDDIPKAPSGFTLIELLVVIAIIGLLSSIILAALTGSRTRANEANIRQELNQLRTIYEVNAVGGDYSALQPATANQSWQICRQYSTGPSGYVCQMKVSSDCTKVFAHDTAIGSSDAAALCKDILNNSGFLEIAVYSNTNITQHYSVVGYLPASTQYVCYGNSGNTSVFTTVGGAFPSLVTGETGAGCPGNP